MVNYIVIDDIPTTGDSKKDEEITTRAQGCAHQYISKLGLDKLVTTDGKGLSATVKEFSGNKIRNLEIEPAEGSGIRNIGDVVNALIYERDVELLPDIQDGIQFRAKVAGEYVLVSVLMNSREEIALRRYRSNTEYEIVGDKQSYLSGVLVKPHPYVLESVMSQLKSTVNKVYTGGKAGSGKLIVTYTTSSGSLVGIDVYPQRGCQVADIEFAKEVSFDARQCRGVISYVDGSTRIKLHRKNFDAKYDIQGMIDQDLGGRIIPQEKKEQDRIMQYLLGLPVTIRPNDDNEINVAYLESRDALKLIISPKANSTVEIRGYDDVVKDGRINVMSSSTHKRKEFTVKSGSPRITCLVFTERGSSGEKKSLELFANADIFDRIYQLYR